MSFFFLNNKQCIFTAILNLLEVKYTKSFSNKYFGEHPHKYNLFGLSKMLSDYKIENIGVKIEEKETDILELEVPFIAKTGSGYEKGEPKRRCEKLPLRGMFGGRHAGAINAS